MSGGRVGRRETAEVFYNTEKKGTVIRDKARPRQS